MKIDRLNLGDFETNCYILRNSDDEKQCLIIDPGFSPEPLVDMLQQESILPQRILLTHGHCDHIAGIELLKNTFGKIPVGISDIDASMLSNCRQNLSWMTGKMLRLDPPEEKFQPNDIVEWNQIKLKVLPCPGHTPGGISFYCAEDSVVFTGDALFAGSIGRHDFPGGNLQNLLRAIREQLLNLPDDTIVYPGHGEKTSIAAEKRSNPFLQ